MTITNGNNNGITAIGDEGLGQQPWWVQQWMELINGYRFKKRLERAWGYAREGNVTSIRFEGRRVHARVQGTGEEPYKVKLWLDVLNDEDWAYVLEALTQKARWSAQLLAGIMPVDIERAFAASGKRLFPFKLQEVRSECSCPDKANPCKHISAVYFLMGDRFSEDPFVLFQLRGRNRAKLLEDLAEQRRKALAALAEQGTQSETGATKEDSAPLPPHPAVLDPSLWWRYDRSLDGDLVVITPAMDGDTGLDAAGELPLAEDPRFPEARDSFLNNLKAHGQASAQQAMLQAMAAGS
ncbi:swim zn-finger containing protein [Synechococcus sp. KORDI-100]|uniref:SWIM zinc finger family protein n=1 Tax=Synechococcus sp. KORDI-100 TaxID=1280380 RepID=UPI0004E06B36|nr:SWIM zinc finger family protein [Synechococcus sp. KORDI-100]AII44739.1 swim zn-finger containing protein [Synechococcus sp. KORDI-100]